MATSVVSLCLRDKVGMCKLFQIRGERAKEVGIDIASFPPSLHPPQTPLIRGVSSPQNRRPPPALPTPGSLPFATGQLPGPDLGREVMDHRVSDGALGADGEEMGAGVAEDRPLGLCAARDGVPSVLSCPHPAPPHVPSSLRLPQPSLVGAADPFSRIGD